MRASKRKIATYALILFVCGIVAAPATAAPNGSGLNYRVSINHNGHVIEVSLVPSVWHILAHGDTLVDTCVPPDCIPGGGGL